MNSNMWPPALEETAFGSFVESRKDGSNHYFGIIFLNPTVGCDHQGRNDDESRKLNYHFAIRQVVYKDASIQDVEHP